MGGKGKGEEEAEKEGRTMEKNGEESGGSAGLDPVFRLNVFG